MVKKNKIAQGLEDAIARRGKLTRYVGDGETLVNSHDLAHMLLCSFRYSLGRMTYITSTCSEWLKQHWHIIPQPWQQQIHDDIRKAIELGHAGHDCDVRSWENVLELPINQDAASRDSSHKEEA